MESDERIGCDRCWPASADAAWEARAQLTHAARLVDDSHFGATILICLGCQQQFVSLFVEIVDWVDGDDSQYWTQSPITSTEAGELVRQGPAVTEAALRGLAPAHRSLQRDYPKGESPRTYWIGGVAI